MVLRDFAMLLAERPIWSSAALKERVTGFTDVEFDIMLPRVAYMFRNGAAQCRFVHRSSIGFNEKRHLSGWLGAVEGVASRPP